jgi:DNA-binding CsgD family transcriptional regulator
VQADQTFHEVLLNTLSPAELEVLRWFCRGLTAPQISQTLFRSPHTVKTQLNSIYKKLGVHSRAELLSFFKHCGYAWTKSQGDNISASLTPPTEQDSSPIE